MIRILFFILLSLPTLAVYAQTNIVKRQAEQLGHSLLQKDYKTFVTYSYPTAVRQMGGPEKMAESISRQMNSMEASGAKLIALQYGTPSPVVKEGNELQCTIPQQMIVQMSVGKVGTKTTLIAISKDNGKKWFFVDAGGRDIATLRKTLPNLSRTLLLPKPEEPKLIN